MQNRAVITGIGLISAAGVGVEETWRRIRSDPPLPSPFSSTNRDTEPIEFTLYQTPAYDINDVGMPTACLQWLAQEHLTQTRDICHLLSATALAVTDAGLEWGGQWAEEMGAIVADEHPGLQTLTQRLLELDLATRRPTGVRQRFAALGNEMFQLNTFLVPYYVAKAFQFGGPCLFVNSACASGLNALDIAAEHIRRGRTRRMVVAASDDPLNITKFLWFSQFGLYATDSCLRPFDAHALGTVFGDGGVALIVEERACALDRGAKIYAEFVGAGFAHDGWRITAPNPQSRRYNLAIRRALDDANLATTDIDLVIPHGAGIYAMDSLEARTLHETFGGDRWPSIAALKPLFGHNLGGSALMDAAVLLMGMRQGQIPPTLNYSAPPRRFALPLRKAWEDRRIRTALKITAAFAGYYAAVIFTKPEDYDA